LLSRDTETVAELAGSVTDTDIAAAATAANDAIVAAYQLLAVLAADGTARTWQQSDDGARRKLVNSLRDPQGTPRDNYCGEMVRSELISAGLADFTDASGSSHFTQIFDHADNVEAFFRYTEDNFRNPAYILPYNDPRQGWMPVADYHALRHSKRALVEPATVTGAQTHGTLDSVMRPGDVATLYYGTQTTSDPAHADHTVLVRRVINGRKFETIEGNSYVTDSAGNAVGNGIGTNEWDTGPTGRDPSQTFHNDVHNRYAKVFLLGRLSVVDFETGHGYSLTDPGQSGSATQGTSSDRAGARSARRNRADL
jgi:hypothetical protein